MTAEEREKCQKIIHSAAISAATAAAGLASLPGADTAIVMPINVEMIRALGKVFDKDLTEQTARTMVQSAATVFAGRAASQLLLGWMIPFLGNAINASTAAGFTESLGWMFARQFEQESKIDPTVLLHAEETFGQETALEWLKSQCEALNNFRPIDLLETAAGRKQVLDVLVCIDNGFVY